MLSSLNISIKTVSLSCLKTCRLCKNMEPPCVVKSIVNKLSVAFQTKAYCLICIGGKVVSIILLFRLLSPSLEIWRHYIIYASLPSLPFLTSAPLFKDVLQSGMYGLLRHCSRLLLVLRFTRVPPSSIPAHIRSLSKQPTAIFEPDT